MLSTYLKQSSGRVTMLRQLYLACDGAGDDTESAEDSDTDGARACLARASRLRLMHSTQWHTEEDNNNLSGRSGSSDGDSGCNGSLNRFSNTRFDGNDSIGDDYDADCEDAEDNSDGDGGDSDEVGEDNI